MLLPLPSNNTQYLPTQFHTQHYIPHSHLQVCVYQYNISKQVETMEISCVVRLLVSIPCTVICKKFYAKLCFAPLVQESKYVHLLQIVHGRRHINLHILPRPSIQACKRNSQPLAASLLSSHSYCFCPSRARTKKQSLLACRLTPISIYSRRIFKAL